MVRKRVIPCLLIKSSGVYKTQKFKNPKYVGDPINSVKIFNDKEVDELLVIDISASREDKKPNFTLLNEIATEAFMPLSYGGGLNNIDDIARVFELGYEKVCLNQVNFHRPQLITQAADRFGRQSVVGAIDIKLGFFAGKKVYDYIRGSNTKIDPLEQARTLEKLGAGELLINFVDREGLGKGYDLELTKKIVKAVDIPVICMGGATSYEDLKKGVLAGAAAVAAGSLFVFQGPHRAVLLSYPNRDKLDEIIRGE